MEPVILTSKNPSKELQIQTLFAGSGIRVLSQEKAGVKGEAQEDRETLDALEANAKRKIDFAAAQLSGVWMMADDTGIFIDALGGIPGAQAAYWGGEGLGTDARMRHCLKQMEGITDRKAVFRTVVVLRSPSGETRVFQGEAPGRILTEPRCMPQPKMPYSSIFLPDGETKTWAEMDTAYENRISHRGKAFAKVKEYLQSTAA